MYRLTIILIACLWFAPIANASVTPSVWVRNYTVEEYKASCQNWDMAICSNKNLYVANNSGLLTFDGNSWEIYQLPDDALITETFCINDTIYTAGPDTQGYWLRDSLNRMKYYLIDKMPSVDKPRFDNSLITVSDEIRQSRPSAYASFGSYNVIGTETNGVYILDGEGDVVVHLSLNNQLQDNIVRALYVQDANRIWVALDNGLSLIHIDPPIALLGKRSVYGKLLAATLHENVLTIQTNIGYYERALDSSAPFIAISADRAEAILKPEAESSSTPIFNQLFVQKDNLDVFADPDHIYSAPDNHYWLTSGNEAGLFHLEEGIGILKCRILFDNYNMNLVNRDTQFFPLNDSLHIVSTMQGIVLVNTRKLIEENLGSMIVPSFKRLEYIDNAGSVQFLSDKEHLSLPYNFRTASIYIYTSLFTPNHQISYKIEGVSSDWSDWQKEGDISFLQLPEGRYTIHVRKYAVKGPFPETAFEITVRPPWYNSIWGYISYLVVIMLLIGVGLKLYISRIRRKEKERQDIIRNAEEQKIQQEKNEWLENELQTKKNELSLQTTALVRRNEAIQSLIDELDRQKETLGERYPNKLYTRMHTLLMNAKGDQADWILFETYFNSAHQNFTERLRQEFSDITTGDLRVCCLLRMNLSTKEIASLLNVSVRAIELRRYRLRKRLGLDVDTNLVDFLINY